MDTGNIKDADAQERILKFARDLFSNYPPTASLCGTDDRLLMKHIMDIRKQAYAIHEYACIKVFGFLYPSITRLWNYESEIVPKLAAPSSAKFLDVGCCFGQAIRRLVIDGADPNNLIGTDLHPEFIQAGYDLFRDGPGTSSPLASRFEAGDIFNDDFLVDLNGQIDIIHASLMLHLFPLKDQHSVAERLNKLLSPHSGSLIVGNQLGVEDASEIQPGGIFRHNSKTFKEFWRSVGDGNWEVDVKEQILDIDHDKYQMKLAQKGDTVIMLRFVVKRLESTTV